VPAPAPPPPGPRTPEAPPAIAALRQRALADLDAALAARAPLVVRISRDGTIEAIEADGRNIALVVPLLEHNPDPGAGVTYAGDRVAELQVCRIAAQRLGIADLSRYLVIMAPAAPLTALPEALVDALRRDLDRCQFEQHGLAALVDPTALAPTQRSTAPAAPGAQPPPPTPPRAPP
jgi:hypothetical protein